MTRLAAVLLLPHAALASPPDWAWRAPVRIPGPVDHGVITVQLPPEVLDGARPDLSDLRVVDAAGAEIGHVTEVARHEVTTAVFEAPLYNRVTDPGRSATVTVDFGERLRKNWVAVSTAGDEFRRRVRVEAGDDGSTWRLLRDGALLFRAAGDGGRVDRELVRLPDNDFRFLRITVFSGPDETREPHILGVRAERRVEEGPEVIPVPVAGANVAHKKGATEIRLDLGYRNLSLVDLELRFADRNFWRRVQVLGRNAETRVVQTPIEGRDATERAVEEPWSFVSHGVVYRFSAHGGQDEDTVVSLAGARYRHILVRVLDGDDPPLAFEGASARRLAVTLTFPPKGAGGWSVLFGSPDAPAPSYDFAHWAGRLRAEGVTLATLDGPIPNAGGGVAPARPWIERNRAAVWAALLLVVAVLGLLIRRQVVAGRKVQG